MKKTYCTQNNGDCSTCSLVNYGRDCQNNSTWGGLREGAGRPATGRKRQNFYVTEEENTKLREYLEKLREPSK
jgi:hypothetical protein